MELYHLFISKLIILFLMIVYKNDLYGLKISRIVLRDSKDYQKAAGNFVPPLFVFNLTSPETKPWDLQLSTVHR